MLASVNSVTSTVPNSQPAQPEKPKYWVYGSKTEVWLYDSFPTGHMVKKLCLPCVYISLIWGIQQLTINDMDKIWDFPLLMQ